MTNEIPSCTKVEMHWHFYGKCGVSISSIRYPGNPASELMHYHDFHELVIVREGTGRHLYMGGSYPLRKGNVFVIRPGTPHSYAECRNFELINVLFFPEQLLFSYENVLETPGIRRLFDPLSGTPPCLNAGTFDAILPLLQAMKRERQAKKADFELAMNANFLQLLLNLSRAVLGMKTAQTAGESRLNQLIVFLKANYSDPQLQISQIAMENNMTLKTLERLFRRHTGVSPAAYLIGLRLDYAAEQLKNPECSVTETALRCGFSNLAYFSRAFRLKYGLSPREYRREHTAMPYGGHAAALPPKPF
ncbi:MAG: helix-turn-helix domain-containing protein [Lentisphaeria bacterium]|nr:helix-turn-helix domain-containing protein [Lentisphaeria bacterium]